MIRVLVCGGRDYRNRRKVYEVLNELHSKEGILVIINGWATGADELSSEWCWKYRVPCFKFPADWEKYGLAAGAIRNTRMLNVGKPQLIVAFPGGRGTANMIHQARGAGVRVIEVKDAA